MRFPTVTTNDLNGTQKTLPDAYAGRLTLALIAYEQWQQQEVDSWLPLLNRLEQENSEFTYIELPVVGKMGWFGRKSLDYFMRTGIKNTETRGRTLTLYVNQAEFRQKLSLETQKTIALVLFDRTGEVIWQGLGPYSEETAGELQGAMDQAVHE